jgi:hypothetical protein
LYSQCENSTKFASLHFRKAMELYTGIPGWDSAPNTIPNVAEPLYETLKIFSLQAFRGIGFWGTGVLKTPTLDNSLYLPWNAMICKAESTLKALCPLTMALWNASTHLTRRTQAWSELNLSLLSLVLKHPSKLRTPALRRNLHSYATHPRRDFQRT